MRIRSHIVLLVAAAVLPLMTFSTIMTVVFWRQQRAAFEDRFIERVRAVSIALDREHLATVSALRGLAESATLDGGDLSRFQSRAREVLAGEESWSAVTLLDLGGRGLVRIPGRSGAPVPSLNDSATFRRVLETGQPAISGLVTSPGRGGYATYIAIPVTRGRALRYVLVAEIDQRIWLRFLSLYPVAPEATMTLLDQNRIVMARTLSNDKWIGRPPSPTLYAKSAELPLGVYRNVGLEGQWFYSAHSRASLSGWSVATGVPVGSVEASLRGSLVAMLVGIAGTGALAIGLVIVLGRRIEQPIRRLAGLARSLARSDTDPSRVRVSNVREVDEVAATLVEAAELIQRRSAELDEALAKETAARAQAEDASRSKDEFLAMLGHELRNPLGAISSATAVLDHAGRSEAAAARARAVIARQVRHLVGIVDDLLDVARVTTGKISLHRQVVDLASIAQGCLNTLRASGRLAGHEVALVAEPAWAEIDVTRIEQVLTNLLVNAVKYTPASGAIRLGIGAEADQAVIVVRDTGIGITAGMLPRIFDLFVQSDSALDRAQGGLGIGLTLVRKIVELHGGSVQASSDGPGQGSTFTVRLPLAAPPAPPHAAAAAAKAGSGRILIVEDNDDAREMLHAMLELWGHDVDDARDADSALACLQQREPDNCPAGYRAARVRRIRAGEAVPWQRRGSPGLPRCRDGLWAARGSRESHRSRLQRPPRQTGQSRCARRGDCLGPRESTEPLELIGGVGKKALEW